MPSAYITGGTGFVGLNLIQRLTQEGWDIRALHRSSSDLTYLSRFDAARVVGDVTDRASLERSMPENVDVVFHVAAA
jgi:dihydroflavonol-4-reductase